MTVTFTEFDTDANGLVAAIKAAILVSTDWSAVPSQTVVRTTFSALEAVGQTTLSIANGDVHFVPGESIVLSPGTANEETRIISGTPSSTLTVVTVATGFSHASGDNVSSIQPNIVKSTCTSTAQLVIDLSRHSADPRGLTVSYYRSHDGTTGVDETPAKTIRCRQGSAAGVATDPIHVTVAAGKDHLVITLEGARSGESATAETNSFRDLLILSDMVLYDAAEPACVYTQGRIEAVITATVAYRSGMLSRDRAGTGAAWQPCVVGSVKQPGNSIISNQMIHLSNTGVVTAFPYLVFDAQEGLRGRLRHVLNAGEVSPMLTSELMLLTPGRKITYAGATWVTVAGMKSGLSNTASNPMYQLSAGASIAHEGPLLLVPFSGTPTA